MIDHLVEDWYSAEHSLGNTVLKYYVNRGKFPKIREGFLMYIHPQDRDYADIRHFQRMLMTRESYSQC